MAELTGDNTYIEVARALTFRYDDVEGSVIVEEFDPTNAVDMYWSPKEGKIPRALYWHPDPAVRQKRYGYEWRKYKEARFCPSKKKVLKPLIS